MSKRTLIPFLLATALGFAGCTSAPVHYYTLLAPVAPADAAASEAPYAIEVLPIGLPESLDRQALVVRQGETGVAILERERWAGPLSEEVQRALSAQLATRLHSQDLTGLAHTSGRPVLRIKVEIRRLDAWPGRQIDLDADWSVGFADAPALRTVCRSHLLQPAPGDTSGLAAAYQQVLGTLAQRIAQAAPARDGAGSVARRDC